MGLGQGSGLEYKPFVFVRDVPSKGRSSIVEGLKVKRTHHYLSDIEYAYHVLAEFSDSVIEIREQYALLPVEETLQIADELGVRHPVYPATGGPRVQTSDLVLTLQSRNDQALHVLCCKLASDVDPRNPTAARTLEKILIEKTFWERRNVPWTLALDTMIPENKFRNLDLFRSSMVAQELDHLNNKLSAFLSVVRMHWSVEITLNQILGIMSEELQISTDESFCLLGRAIWTKKLAVNLDSTLIAHESPLPELTMANEA